MNNNPQGNNQNRNKNLQNQSCVEKESVNFFRLTSQQVTNKINDLESVISTDHSSLAPHTNDPSRDKTSNVFFRKRFNSIDSSILEESAYKALDNEKLILEVRIEHLETELSKVIEKIEVAKTIKNDTEYEELKNQKENIENDILNLKNSHKQNDLESIITNVLVSFLTLPKRIKNETKLFIKNFLRKSNFTKRIKPLFRALMIRDTLNKLNKINNSIDELVKMQVPIGENKTKYETLVNHLLQAGTLHSQIKKELKS